MDENKTKNGNERTALEIEIIESRIGVIADCMAGNEHDVAAVHGAHLLGDTRLLEIFHLVGRIAALEGRIPEELHQYRTRKVCAMMSCAGPILGDELAEKLRAAYQG